MLIDRRIFATFPKLESEGSITTAAGGKDEGRILGEREKSIIAMSLSVENSVKNANGQIVQRILKNKELRMTSAELKKLIASLLEFQATPFVWGVWSQAKFAYRVMRSSLFQVSSCRHWQPSHRPIPMKAIRGEPALRTKNRAATLYSVRSAWDPDHEADIRFIGEAPRRWAHSPCGISAKGVVVLPPPRIVIGGWSGWTRLAPKLCTCVLSLSIHLIRWSAFERLLPGFHP